MSDSFRCSVRHRASALALRARSPQIGSARTPAHCGRQGRLGVLLPAAQAGSPSPTCTQISLAASNPRPSCAFRHDVTLRLRGPVGEGVENTWRCSSLHTSRMDCGLSGVALATSDAHRGLTEAIGTTVPGAAWRRCRTHYAANLMSVTPKSAWGGSARCCTASMTQPGAASHTTPQDVTSLPRRSGTVTATAASWSLRAGMTNRRPQPRQHPEACACTFGVFYTDIRRMNETANETTRPYGLMTGLMYCLVRGGGG